MTCGSVLRMQVSFGSPCESRWGLCRLRALFWINSHSCTVTDPRLLKTSGKEAVQLSFPSPEPPAVQGAYWPPPQCGFPCLCFSGLKKLELQPPRIMLVSQESENQEQIGCCPHGRMTCPICYHHRDDAGWGQRCWVLTSHSCAPFLPGLWLWTCHYRVLFSFLLGSSPAP